MQCKPIAEYAQNSAQDANSETSEDLEYRDRRIKLYINLMFHLHLIIISQENARWVPGPPGPCAVPHVEKV